MSAEADVRALIVSVAVGDTLHVHYDDAEGDPRDKRFVVSGVEDLHAPRMYLRRAPEPGGEDVWLVGVADGDIYLVDGRDTRLYDIEHIATVGTHVTIHVGATDRIEATGDTPLMADGEVVVDG